MEAVSTARIWDDRQPDFDFRGRRRVEDEAGAYEFGNEPLITQVFFPDDPHLEDDTIGAVKAALVRPVEPEDDHLVCPFDIVLRPAA